jgi:hypothetical protein
VCLTERRVRHAVLTVLRRSNNAGQEFPHGHACVSNALIGPRRPRRSTTRSVGGIGRAGADRYHRRITTTEDPAVADPVGHEAEAPAPAAEAEAEAEAAAEAAAGTPTQTVSRLRGAGVQVDGRRVAGVIVVAVLASLAILAVALAVIGAHDNAQIDELHHDGVPVTFTVSSCRGNLGGSGSNVAGYSCFGSYTLDGHRYSGPLPGMAYRPNGSRVPSIAVPGDPALVSPVTVVDAQHASDRVYVLPIVFGVSFLAGAGLVLQRWRRHRADGATPT